LRRARKPFEGELNIDWERWADGRARRLKRRRDFPDVEPALIREDADAAAKRMGRGVVTAKDRFLPDKYLWVQFSNHRIAPGQPCVCGSWRLLRVHANFLRCPDCRALITISEDEETEEDRERAAARRLRKLSHVHLEHRGQSGDREVYRGHARMDGTPVLLWAEFRLKPREDRLEEEVIFDRVVAVQTVPLPELTELFDSDETDVAKLWNGREPDWDFVWIRPPEPDSAREADEAID
jgi:hypothetical protein